MEVNKIYNIDCLAFMKTLPDKCIDLVVTDPPYEFTTGGGLVGKDRDYVNKLRDLDCLTFNPTEFLNILKPKMKIFNGYFFCNKKLIKEYLQFAEDNNFMFDVLVMAKDNPIPAYRGHHLSDLEYIIFIRDNGSYFNQDGKYFDDFRKFYLTQSKQGLHPAEKPLGIVTRYIRLSSKENDIVFDPYLGCGTTAVACIQNKRNYIGCEISPEYCKIAQDRIKSISNPLF